MEEAKAEEYREFARAYLAFYSGSELRAASFEDAIRQFRDFEADWLRRSSGDTDLTLTVRRTVGQMILYWHYRHERPAEECDRHFRGLKFHEWGDLHSRFFPVTLHARYCLRWGWLDEAELDLRLLGADAIEGVIKGADPQARQKLSSIEELLSLVGIARFRPVTVEGVAPLKEALDQVTAAINVGDEATVTKTAEVAAALAEELKEQYQVGLSLPRDLVRLVTGFLVATHGYRGVGTSGEGDGWRRLLHALQLMA